MSASSDKNVREEAQSQEKTHGDNGLNGGVNSQVPVPPTEKSTARKKRKRANAPSKLQPGDQGYLTPTQLRNARKRRANKKTTTITTNSDPSGKYLGNPLATPICQTAKEYFRAINSSGTFDIHIGPTTEWRTVAKLAVRGNPLSIGLFAPKSHELVAVPDCTAHHQGINSTVAHLEQCCHRAGVTAFDETTGKGNIRFAAMNVERATGKVQLTIVWNSEPYNVDNDFSNNADAHDDGKNQLERLVQMLCPKTSTSTATPKQRRRGTKKKPLLEQTDVIHGQENKVELHSLWIHFNSSWKHSNAIFAIDAGPNSWKQIFGPPAIVEHLTLVGQPRPVPLHFPPNVFRQANLDAFTKIVAKIRTKISEFTNNNTNKMTQETFTCVELYGGVGTIGLNVADLVTTLTSSDENPFNKDCFEKSATEAGLMSRVGYESKNATDMVLGKRNGAFQQANIILVDPPRKGLEEPVLNSLCSSSINAKLLVYVSCGFEAFKRDCGALLDSGKWSLDQAEGHLLFPGSDAIETLAFFVAKK